MRPASTFVKPVTPTLLMQASRRLHAIVKSRIFRAAVGVLIAISVCQVLPQPSTVDKQAKHLSLWQLFLGIFSPIAKRMPTVMGWWSVEVPYGNFSAVVPSAEDIREEASRIMPIIDALKEKTFFRIFKVDLDKECPFWARDDLCSSPTGSCAVCECTDDQIPLPWKQKPIEHFVDRKFFDEEEVTPWLEPSFTGLPGSAGEAEGTFLSSLAGTDEGGVSTYVDLSLNSPRFTAYKGRSIWGLIYKENCLLHSEEDGSAGCQEEEIFTKIISGLQTAVMVLASEYNAPFNHYLSLPLTAPSKVVRNHVGSQPPRHWYNLNLFRYSVAGHRDWMENLYLDFSLLIRTLAKVAGIVDSCPCYTGTAIEDRESRAELEKLLKVISDLPSASPDRLSAPLFNRKQEVALRQFTNISRIFDCVECEACRLHGKVKLAALQVAIKAAGPGPLPVKSLERNEITAIINAIGYFAESVLIIGKFQRRVWAFRQLSIMAPALVFGSAGLCIWALLGDVDDDKRNQGLIVTDTSISPTTTRDTNSTSEGIEEDQTMGERAKSEARRRKVASSS